MKEKHCEFEVSLGYKVGGWGGRVSKGRAREIGRSRGKRAER